MDKPNKRTASLNSIERTNEKVEPTRSCGETKQKRANWCLTRVSRAGRFEGKGRRKSILRDIQATILLGRWQGALRGGSTVPRQLYEGGLVIASLELDQGGGHSRHQLKVRFGRGSNRSPRLGRFLPKRAIATFPTKVGWKTAEKRSNRLEVSNAWRSIVPTLERKSDGSNWNCFLAG